MPTRLNGLEKSQYTFALRHACLQDELVFKSLVRFLMNLLRHKWRYDAGAAADVLVVGYEPIDDGFDGSDRALAKRVHIRVGASEAAPKQLVRPLRVSAVLLALNLAGDEIDRQRAEGELPSSVAAVFSLLRWPPLHVLRIDQRFIRITAMLAANPSTVDAFVAKSGQAHAVCEHLLYILKTEGLIVQTGGANSASPAGDAKSPTGADNAAPSRTPNATSLGSLRAPNPLVARESVSAESGLWGRIRRRLGITGTSSNFTKSLR